LIPIAFAAGLLSFVSPCIIPMIAVYFTLITGLTVEQLTSLEDKKQIRRSVFIKTLLFVLAFTAVFTLAGGAAGSVGKLFSSKLWLFNLLGGIFVTLLGLKMMGLVRGAWLDRLNLQQKISINYRSKNGYLMAFLVGIFFAVACSHCIGPTLYSVLIAAGSTGSALAGMQVMFIFSIGLAIPYLVVAFFITEAFNKVKAMTRLSRQVSFVVGLLMVFFGVLMALNKFSLLTGFFYKLLPYKLPLGM